VTRYVVLELDRGEHVWRDLAAVDAHSAEAAIRKYAGDQGGTFVAVPERSWTAYTASVETRRQIKLEVTGAAAEEGE
jgi:hypothetical protein